MPTFLFLIIFFIQTNQSTITHDQFSRIMEERWSDRKDIGFVYEGQFDYWPKAPLIGPAPKPKAQALYQGAYVMRSDGRRHLDLYVASPDNNNSLLRRTWTSANEGMEETHSVPDADGGKASVSTHSGNDFSMPKSPEHFFFWGQLREMAKSPLSYHYEFLGWESIEGHRCLKVRLNFIPDDPKPKSEADYRIFWIDLERGGNALKVELHSTKGLISRCDGIKLESFSVGGKTHWIPIGGQRSMFPRSPTEFSQTPVTRESYEVVSGSVIINQGVPDAFFSASKRSRLPRGTGTEKLQASLAHMSLATQFEQAADAVPEEEKRTDPVALEKKLNRMLDEAKKQGTLIEASSSASLTSDWLYWSRYAIMGLGASALIFCLYWRWRRAS